VNTGYAKIKTATEKIFNKWTIRQKRQQRVVQLIKLIIYSLFFFFIYTYIKEYKVVYVSVCVWYIHFLLNVPKR